VDNTESTFGMTPLDMAILMGDVESTAQLLAAGADPEHLLKLFALTDLYDVTVVHPDKKKTRELLDEDDKVCSFVRSFGGNGHFIIFMSSAPPGPAIHRQERAQPGA